MGSNPINLAFRFLLELTVLGILGFWGWTFSESIWKYPLAIGIPLSAAIIWGIFAVPNDPSRSGKAPVPVPGWLRLIIEFLLFGSGSWALFSLGYQTVCLIFTGIVLIHYIVSYDRIIWLLKRN